MLDNLDPCIVREKENERERERERGQKVGCWLQNSCYNVFFLPLTKATKKMSFQGLPIDIGS